MPDEFKLEVTGDRALTAFFQKYENIGSSPAMRQALAAGAMELEREAKKELTRMVYSQPDPTPSGYVRTRDLFNKTQAIGVESTGVPEVKTNPQKTVLTSGVTSAVKYAIYVYTGKGGNIKIGPRPYLTNAAQKVKKKFMQYIEDALNL